MLLSLRIMLKTFFLFFLQLAYNVDESVLINL
jgi:hypothetical protein